MRRGTVWFGWLGLAMAIGFMVALLVYPAITPFVGLTWFLAAMGWGMAGFFCMLWGETSVMVEEAVAARSKLEREVYAYRQNG